MMTKGVILEKGGERYTYFKKIFQALNNFQKDYNWLITDCEAYPKKQGHAVRITQSKDGNYAWISGVELTGIVRKDDFQWIWGVLSGFDKRYSKEEVLQYGLPYADGYSGFWKEEVTVQHPLASVELVAWDGSLTLLISEREEIVRLFREAFPHSEDLGEYNRQVKEYRMGLIDDSAGYGRWLEEKSFNGK